MECMRSSKEMDALHKAAIIALLEPRIGKAAACKVCKKLGKRDWFRVEAKEFSGGIWVLRKRGEVKLKAIHTHEQFIHLSINASSKSCWFLMVVYASLCRT